MNAFMQRGTSVKFKATEQTKVATEVSQPPKNARKSIAFVDKVAEDAERALKQSHGNRPPSPAVKRWKS